MGHASLSRLAALVAAGIDRVRARTTRRVLAQIVNYGRGPRPRRNEGIAVGFYRQLRIQPIPTIRSCAPGPKIRAHASARDLSAPRGARRRRCGSGQGSRRRRRRRRQVRASRRAPGSARACESGNARGRELALARECICLDQDRLAGPLFT